MESFYFLIAGHGVCLRFQTSQKNSIQLLPSLSVFQTSCPPSEVLFTMTVDDSLKPAKERQLVRKFDTGNGDTVVYQLPDGGYQFIIRDIRNRDCCLLICNSTFTDCRCALNGDWVMRSFGLNDALMLVYAFAGSFHQTLLIHASAVIHQGNGYPFIAQSGTGKSTHSSLWMKHIDGCSLMNDDNPIVRLMPDKGNKPYIFGSPWSGKTPCYRNISAPLGAVVKIERAPQNSIERLQPIQAFASLLPACSTMKWDSTIYSNLCDAVTRIIETTNVYTLHCLPDKEAALLCNQTIASH